MTVLFIFMLTISSIYSQSITTVPYYNWSKKAAFIGSPDPKITGYGPLSDSLSNIFGGITFYVSYGKYFPITTWAEYYLWYIDRFWYKFSDPLLYYYYFMIGDDHGMAEYICGNNFHGLMYPSRIAVSFPNKNVYVNNLSPRKVRRKFEKDDWNNKKFIPVNEVSMYEKRLKEEAKLITEKSSILKSIEKKSLVNRAELIQK
ncbi:MAG: hypothetical protein HC831_13395 [Chloroflexia bacterium]|nr:hypothetical protein [Chloroflexia bacterium]